MKNKLKRKLIVIVEKRKRHHLYVFSRNREESCPPLNPVRPKKLMKTYLKANSLWPLQEVNPLFKSSKPTQLRRNCFSLKCLKRK